MEKKYIGEARYKKVTSRKRRNSKTVRSNLNSKHGYTSKIVSDLYKKEIAVPVETNSKVSSKSKLKKKIKRKKKESKLGNVLICLFLLIIIAVISRAIFKDENEPFLPFSFLEASNEQIVKIGVITADSLISKDTSNIVLNELHKYSKDMLLEITEDYTINYKVVSSVEKISNTEYILVIRDDSSIKSLQIKNELESYMINKKSVYYFRLNNIQSISIIGEKRISIKLNEPDEYFIYNLDICLSTANDNATYLQTTSSSDTKLVLNRQKTANKQLPAQIVAIRYKDMYSAVEAYKQKEIDLFVTDAENVQNILGKCEYNIKTYRNGKCIFLFANPTSPLYSREEVRKVIAYSLDRDGIINEILKSKGEKIDLPYIYDNVKYKYDVYAAENLLLTNQYTKKGKVYSKVENGAKINLELDLIVNKKDEIKIAIANKIKNNLSAIGVKINIEELSEAKIEERIQNGKYDLCLANVSLNNNPNISFLYNNLYLTEEIKEKMEVISNATCDTLSSDVKALQQVLSKEISAIGIYSDVSYVIYSKDIVGMQDIRYMNLFKGIIGEQSQ